MRRKMLPFGQIAVAARSLLLAASIVLGWVCSLPALAAPPAPAAITLLTVNDAIGPAHADYVVRGIARAAENGSQLVVLHMDTPGGLDTSMRSIIKAILTSPVPVASYVAPSGARAASAGTYILYASHIAAMAPGTNVGAATPVQVGISPGDQEQEKRFPRRENNEPGKEAGRKEPTDQATTTPMTRKQVNDAAAYIRGLAQMRGRNADWAERSVREAVSLPAEDALKQGVIDLIAADVPALARQLDGKKVNALGQEKILRTNGAPIVDAAPDWRTRLLGTITSPSVALLLMTIGIYGLMFEFMNPGGGVPGVVGAICLLLALYALQLLPVNYAGLALIVLGMAFMAAEAFLPSFGVLGLGGIAAFVAGALILIDTELPGYGIPVGLIGVVGVLSFALIAATVAVALKTRRRAIVSGAAGLIGKVGEVRRSVQGESWIQLQGELWRAAGESPLKPGQKVRVVARRGLVLQVVPADNDEQGEQA